ncbi:MAG: LytTR family transcriptional regulator [Muricauda sp. TMED12]|nr:MAG: LytTR family transcriptional regulator [Muricauda sp. TMED12]
MAGILQRVFIYFYYDLIFNEATASLFDFFDIIRAIVLVNTTVLFLSAIRMYDYWRIEQLKNGHRKENMIEIWADKRTYRVSMDSKSFIEALGNYVTYYFTDRKHLISYSSLKEVEEKLSGDFVRIHKSFVVNKHHVESYTKDNVQVNDRIIPIGKSISIKF